MKVVYRPCCGGRTKRAHLGPALAEVGALPSTNNMVEGGVNSQLRAVLRNRRGLTSAKRAKTVCWWCRARSGDARTACEKLACGIEGQCCCSWQFERLISRHAGESHSLRKARWFDKPVRIRQLFQTWWDGERNCFIAALV